MSALCCFSCSSSGVLRKNKDMANGLYDSGKPQRIIVEHEVRTVSRSMDCPNCGRDTDRIPCVWCDFPITNKKPVTITPQFEHVKERKKLK